MSSVLEDDCGVGNREGTVDIGTWHKQQNLSALCCLTDVYILLV